MKDRLQEALRIREKKAVDLVRDLDIPKSAVSQYLSGKSQNMDSKRLYAICKYLDISEPWLMGYDISMERTFEKTNDTLTDVLKRLRTDSDFFSVVESLNDLDAEQLRSVKQMLAAFLK